MINRQKSTVQNWPIKYLANKGISCPVDVSFVIFVIFFTISYFFRCKFFLEGKLLAEATSDEVPKPEKVTQTFSMKKIVNRAAAAKALRTLYQTNYTILVSNTSAL